MQQRRLPLAIAVFPPPPCPTHHPQALEKKDAELADTVAKHTKTLEGLRTHLTMQIDVLRGEVRLLNRYACWC